MPRPTKPARLWLRASTRRKPAVWVILDRGQETSTRCGAEDRAGAEQALEAYLADKREPSRKKGQSIDEILIADVMAIYLRDRVPEQAKPDKAAARIVQLLEWWGDKALGDINGRTCRDYLAWRLTHAWKSSKPEKTGNPPRMMSSSGVRRELEDLSAAVGYHQSEGYHRENVVVWLPPRGKSRTRYLKRGEVALLLWTAWRKRENMVVTRGPRRGRPVASKRRPWRHLARFLLIGVYTGTRAAAIGGAAFQPTPGHGWIDLKTGLYYRAEEGAKESTKRQPTILIPRRLLMHIRRWKRKNPKQQFVVEWNGKPVGETNKGFRSLCRAAGLGPEVVPHVARHTCATWLAQRGASMTDAAAYLGMSQAIYEKTYRHHSPTLRGPGWHSPAIFEIFDPRYHPTEIIVDDGWVEEEEQAA